LFGSRRPAIFRAPKENLQIPCAPSSPSS